MVCLFSFSKNFGTFVGPDVTLAVLSVLHSGKYLRKMNFTHIVLIPKKNDPQNITDFHPISLGNVVSYIVSKVLANWVKSILPNVISDAQSAFIPNRLITNNTTVAYEMLHRMRNQRKGKTCHMAIKLDISKAYDRVEWSFLRWIMLKMGLPDQWVNLAMETVRTASYSILINGEPKGLIKPTRGIKQGDCAERLSSVIKGYSKLPRWHSYPHLLFVDDSLLFCETKRDEWQQLLDILTQYEEASGQAINKQKTTIFFSKNTTPSVKEEIQNLFGAQVMTNCEKYLGLPMVRGKSKVNTFKDLQEQITKRVIRWKEKIISKAGREVLIKMVA